MERLNWAVLGLICIVTALGLGTSSGAGKTKSDAQPVSVTATPTCSACQASGACGDKSLNKKDSIVSITRTGETFDVVASEDHKSNSRVWIDVPNGVAISKSRGLIQDLDMLVCEGECPLCKKKDEVPNLEQALAPRSGLVELYNPTTATTDCPLTKAADAIANLTKHYVCEGGDCLTKPGHGTLTITAVDPATEKPEGLLNLLAAAEVTATAQSDQGPVSSTITISSEDLTKAGTGTLTLSVKAADDKPAVAIVTETKAADAKPAIDNSRAAVRAAKLAKLEAKMEEPWMLAFNETPLTQAVAALQTKLGVPVLLDMKALEEIAFDPGTPLTADQQPEIETGELLRGCLRNHGLTWVIPASNDRILITSLQAMEQTTINRVYDVTDLIDEDQGTEGIIERIQALVEPTTWKANGGQGDLTVWQKGNRVSLVSSNTYWAQRAIATLLEDLRLNSGVAGTHAAIRVNQPEVAVLKNYELPSLFNIKEQKDKQKQLEIFKQSLLAVLKNEPGFDSAVFEALEFGNRTVLMTKQLPAVHQQIQRVLLMLKQHPGFGGGGSVIPVVGSKAYPNFF